MCWALPSTSIYYQSLPISIREGHSLDLPLHVTALADPASEIHHLLSDHELGSVPVSVGYDISPPIYQGHTVITIYA